MSETSTSEAHDLDLGDERLNRRGQGRQGDPPPGPQAIWAGIRRMTDFASARQSFGPDE